MNASRYDGPDHRLEAAVVFNLIVHGSNISVRVYNAIAAFHNTIELFAFPMIKRNAARLIDVVTKRIVNLDSYKRDK